LKIRDIILKLSFIIWVDVDLFTGDLGEERDI